MYILLHDYHLQRFYPIIVSVGANAANAITRLSNRVRNFNEKIQQRGNKRNWPPAQARRYIPLVLLNYKDQRTLEHTNVMAELVYKGHIDEVGPVTSDESMLDNTSVLLREVRGIDNTSIITKDIEEILSPLESSESRFILITGPPGIGKSVLLKEIAYRWSKHQITVLEAFHILILVFLREPAVQQMKSLDELLQLFCKGDKNAAEIVSPSNDYLLDNGGKDIAFLFDGLDEFPKDLQQDSLVMEIINREVLPLCGLVVSSRPYVSEKLQTEAALTVDILGFTENERTSFINEALQGNSKKIEVFTNYLERHWTISSLCFIPLNLNILIYLYKHGNPLPKNSTELYNGFICHTIHQNLIRSDPLIRKPITNLEDLSLLSGQPIYKMINQLSKLSLDALNNEKLVFTLDEIKSACPDMDIVPGLINGFGLLQTVQHLDSEKTMTFNFVHFSIQEFLAARYITNFTEEEELQLLLDKFWSNIHSNMFTMYIALTKGQRRSFKLFLSVGDDTITISEKHLDDQLKCLRLYRCFYEAEDHRACKAIENARIFKQKIIDLTDRRLTPSDVECVGLFLKSSCHKEWTKVDLRSCYIQERGLRVLHHWLCTCNSNITIAKLRLSKSGFTSMSSSSFICEITTACRVKELWIANNVNIGEDKQFYSILTCSSSTLEALNLDYTELSSDATIHLFNTLGKNNTVKELYIAGNNITDDDYHVCDAITAAVKINNTLEKLWMYGNQFSVKAIKLILQALQENNALRKLAIPVYTEDVTKEFIPLVQDVNNIRESRNCQVKLQDIYHWS